MTTAREDYGVPTFTRQQTRRVLISPEPPEYMAARWDAKRSPVGEHPIVRLTDDGPDFGTWPDEGSDEIGYGVDAIRRDNCLAAAIATALQHPIETVPSLHIHERLMAGEDPQEISRESWECVTDWAAGLGLELTFHDGRAVPAQRDRWIGVVRAPDASRGFGWDHCLVMSYGRLVFDPGISVAIPAGYERACYTPADIYYGISFDKKEN